MTSVGDPKLLAFVQKHPEFVILDNKVRYIITGVDFEPNVEELEKYFEAIKSKADAIDPKMDLKSSSIEENNNSYIDEEPISDDDYEDDDDEGDNDGDDDYEDDGDEEDDDFEEDEEENLDEKPKKRNFKTRPDSLTPKKTSMKDRRYLSSNKGRSRKPNSYDDD